MIAKLENLGCQGSVVGMVIPTDYPFNLDGTCTYLIMAALSLAQPTNTDLTLAHQLGVLGVLLLTSRRAAGVSGSGFIVLNGDTELGWYDPGGEHRVDPCC
jgi:aerobic C4-dicarboxylate transport protein